MTSRDQAPRAGEELEPDTSIRDLVAAAVQGTQMPVVIADARQDDTPIIFANDAFLEMTGYARAEVLGRNCRFLQGPGTDPAAVAAMRSVVEERVPHFKGDILNYRRDGTPFWNALFMSPVRDDAGELVYFLASQLDASARKEEERAVQQRADDLEVEVRRRTADLQRTVDDLQSAMEAKTVLLHEVDHRVKNNLQMIASLVQLQARRTSDEGTREGLSAVVQRVEALSTVQRRLYQGSDVSRFDVADFARDLATNLVNSSGRRDIALELDLEPVEIAKDKAAPLALLVNELITNAVRHAFKERGGRLAVRVKLVGSRVRLEIEDDGVGRSGQELGQGSFGRMMVDVLSRQLQATVDWAECEAGTRVNVELPLAFVEDEQPAQDRP